MKNIIYKINICFFLLFSILAFPAGRLHAKTITGAAGWDLTFSLDTKNHTLTFEGEGPMGDYMSSEYISKCEKHGKLHWILGEGITRIIQVNSNAASYMKSIELPNSLETIDDTAFRYCSSLENIVIPENVKSIGQTAFRDCISLKTVENYSNQTIYLPSYPLKDSPRYIHYNYYVDGVLTQTVPPGKTAVGKVIPYQAHLFAKGGNLKKKYNNILYRYAEPLILPTVKKKGYIFCGWTTYRKYSNYSWFNITNEDNGDVFGSTMNWEGPQNLYAQYAKVTTKKMGKKKLMVNLSKWYNADQLEIQYSTNKNFKNHQSIIVKSEQLMKIWEFGKINKKKHYKLNYKKNKKQLTLTLNKLKTSKRYYFRFQFSGYVRLNADEYVYETGDWFQKSVKM